MTERTTPLIYVTVRDVAGNRERVTEQSHRIKKLKYTDSIKHADKCVLSVDNFDLANFDDPLWSTGNLLQVTWGYPNNMALARELVIVKVTGFTVLSITARAKSIVMDAKKESKTFGSVTRSDVVKQIAAKYGYSGDTLHVQETQERLEHITQPRLSDAQLLRRLAHQQGFEFYVDQDGLHWHERKLIQRPLREFVYYTDQRRGDVLNIRVEMDVTKRPAKVVVKARDHIAKKTVTAEASDPQDSNREGTASILLVKDPDLRAGTLVYVPEDVTPATTGAQTAEVEAKAKYRRAQRAAVKMELDAIGDPTMLAKSLVRVSGVGQRLSGNYEVREVDHDVAPGNYLMSLKLVSDGTGLTNRARGTNENGLPEVTPTISHAKRATEDPLTQDVDPSNANPDALVPVPIYDEQGNEIGTGWAVRAKQTVTIRDGKAVKQ